MVVAPAILVFTWLPREYIKIWNLKNHLICQTSESNFICSLKWRNYWTLVSTLQSGKEMWDTVFNLFGLTWVIPKRVVDLLSCWQGKMGRHRNIEVWRAVPHCLMWCLWKERNARLFKDNDQNVLELKMLFFRTLFGWMTATGLFPSLSYLEFFDLCSIRL